MSENPDFDELLLEWEEQEIAANNIAEFCESRGIHDEATVQEFAKRASALERVTRFLSSGDVAESTRVSALSEQQIEIINRIEIQEAFAFGGRSAIHTAIEQPISRSVALKTLLARTYDEDLSRARLVREAKILASLQHPGILPVYQLCDSTADDTFYTMPLVAGATLQENIARIFNSETVSFAEQIVPLVRRFTQVCQATGYAHSQGISHRDIKPENILLGDFGRTYLVDWGIARSIAPKQNREQRHENEISVTSDSNPNNNQPMANEQGAQLTSPGASMGTPGYMSPEQATGSTDYDEIKSDIFNLGATLYCILTGRAPYGERTLPATISAAAECQFAAPRKLNPSIPRPLESICLKAMSHLPGDRYDRAQDIQRDIDCWLADLPFAGHRETIGEKIARWNRRNGKWVAVMLAMAATVVLTAIIATVLTNSQKQRSDANTRLAWQTVNETVRDIESNESLKFANNRPLRDRLLQASLDNYKKLLSNPANQTALQGELGQAYLQSGKLRSQLQQLDLAKNDIATALDIFRAKLDRSPDQQAAENAAECLLLLNSIDKNRGLDDLEKIEQTVERWVVRFPESSKLQRAQIESSLQRARQMTDRNATKRLVDQLKKQIDNSEIDRQTKLELGIRLKLVQLQAENDVQVKSRLLDEAIGDYGLLFDSKNADIDIQLSLALDYAMTLRQRSTIATDPAEKLNWMVREQALIESMSAKFPTVLEFRTRHQEVLLALTKLYRQQSKFELALQACETAKELNTGLPNPNRDVSPNLAKALLDVAQWHRSNGRTQESQAALLRAVGVFEQSNDSIPPETQQMLGQNLLVIGVDQWLFGNAKAARESFVRSHTIFTELSKSDRKSMQLRNLDATSVMAIALSDAMLEKPNSAIPQVHSAIAEFKEIQKKMARTPAEQANIRIALHTSHFLLAALLERTDRADEAEKIRQQMKNFTPSSADAAFQLAKTYAWEAQIYGRGKPQLSDNDLFFVKQYHRQIMSLIETAVASGFTDMALIEKEPNFMVLFRYKRFRDLLDNME